MADSLLACFVEEEAERQQTNELDTEEVKDQPSRISASEETKGGN